MKRSVLVGGLVLVGALLGTTHRASAISGIPSTITVLWIDDLGNGAATSRSWTDSNADYSPGCSLLNLAANGECGPAAATLPLPSWSFRIGQDPGPGGQSAALWYPLPSSGTSVAPGDVVVDGGNGVPTLLIRFNGDSAVFVYSYLGYLGEQPPVTVDANAKTLAGLNPLTTYVPQEGDPGFGYSTNASGYINYFAYVFRRPTTRVMNTRYLPLSGGTLTGSLTASAFSGDGGGLTGLNPGSLSAGTAGIDISGNALTATNAVNAANAANAALLGGVAPTSFARRDLANAFVGAQTIDGSLAVGGGAAITQHLSATYNVALPSLKPSRCLDLPQVLNGAVAGANDTIALGIPNGFLSAGGFLIFQAWESAANSITIRACNVNPSGPASSAVSGTIRVDMWKH